MKNKRLEVNDFSFCESVRMTRRETTHSKIVNSPIQTKAKQSDIKHTRVVKYAYSTQLKMSNIVNR